MSCDVGKATEGLENELCYDYNYELLLILQTFRHFTYAHLILQPFSHFTYVTTHSPTLPSLYLRHILFSNPSVASPTSHLILQPFSRFSYVTGSSLTSPGEPPMFFQSVKIMSMTSFGREVKAWVSCRRFTARKRTSSRN